MEKLKALQHPYPSLKDKIDKYGYDNKQLHHILRMNDFIKRYGSGENFRTCLIPKDVNYLLKIKSTFMPVNEAVELANTIDKDTRKYKDEHISDIDVIDTDVIKILNDIQYQILKYRFLISA